MAKPFTIDRRQLLVSGAAVTATGIMPADACAEAADTGGLAPASISESEPAALNFCPATLQRLAWISTERYSPNSRTAPSQSAESLAC
jgi:hypothetical protein